MMIEKFANAVAFVVADSTEVRVFGLGEADDAFEDGTVYILNWEISTRCADKERFVVFSFTSRKA